MIGQFTAVYAKHGRWYTGYVKEISGVNTQGRTLAEAKKNLKEALILVVKSNRALARRIHGKGRRHSIYWNPNSNRTSSVPRHTEISDFLAKKICRDLSVPTVR